MTATIKKSKLVQFNWFVQTSRRAEVAPQIF